MQFSGTTKTLQILTNLMYNPRALFSRVFLNICLFVLSLYTVFLLLSAYMCYGLSHCIAQYFVFCLYDNALAAIILKATWLDLTWLDRWLASDPPLWNTFWISVITDYSRRAKYGLCRLHTYRDLAVWSFLKWPPAAILDLIQPEMAPFHPPSSKNPP